MTPSLLPRDWLFQGVVSGLTLVTGYALGVFLGWCWRTWASGVVIGLLEPIVPPLRRRWRDWLEARTGERNIPEIWRLRLELATVVALLIGIVVWAAYAVHWQAQLAGFMGTKAYTAGEFLLVVPVGLGLGVALILVGRGVLWFADKLADVPLQGFEALQDYEIVRGHDHRWLAWDIPDGARFAAVRLTLTWLIVLLTALLVVEKVVPGTVVRGAESVFSVRDREIREDLVRPTIPERSGGPGSPLAWEELGAFGTRFVSLGAGKEKLTELTGRPAEEPIRVYAGLHHGVDDQERADAVVQELERTNAKERAAIMVAPTTGTGWVNPTAAQAFELMFGGDTAIAAAQYSYLPSAVQFIAGTDRVRDAGKQLVGAIVDWWNTLPKGDRPKLYVYGESLGVIAGEGAFSGVRDIAASVDGVLWLGPPNASELWSSLVARRDPGSREVSPEYSGGLMVRFAQNTEEILSWKDETTQPRPGGWTHPRVLFVQHPSDPVVWWNPRLIYEEPDWLKEHRGFDRSPAMSWMPAVTFWQVTMDLPVAANVPNGHGHNYGSTVLDGLAAIDGGKQFTPKRITELHEQLDEAMKDQGPEKEVGVNNKG